MTPYPPENAMDTTEQGNESIVGNLRMDKSPRLETLGYLSISFVLTLSSSLAPFSSFKKKTPFSFPYNPVSCATTFGPFL